MNRMVGPLAVVLCALGWLALFVASGFSVLALDLGLIGALGLTGATQAQSYGDRRSRR